MAHGGVIPVQPDWTVKTTRDECAKMVMDIIQSMSAPAQHKHDDKSKQLRHMRSWWLLNYPSCNERMDLPRPKTAEEAKVQQKEVMHIKFERPNVETDQTSTSLSDLTWLAYSLLRYRDTVSRVDVIRAASLIDNSDSAATGVRFNVARNLSQLRLLLRKMCIEWNATHKDALNSKVCTAEHIKSIEAQAVVLVTIREANTPAFELLGLCARYFWYTSVYRWLVMTKYPHTVYDTKKISDLEPRLDSWLEHKMRFKVGDELHGRFRSMLYQVNMPIAAREQYTRLNPQAAITGSRMGMVYRCNLECLRLSDQDVADREKALQAVRDIPFRTILGDRQHPYHDTLVMSMFIYFFTQQLHVDFAAKYLILPDQLFVKRLLIEKQVELWFTKSDGTKVPDQHRRPLIVVCGGAVHVIHKELCYPMANMKSACIAWLCLVAEQHDNRLEDQTSISSMSIL